MTAALLGGGLRDAVRTRVFQSVYQTFRTQTHLVHLRTLYPTSTPPLRLRWQAHTLQVRQQTRNLATSWIPNWASTWLQQQPAQQTAPPTAPPAGDGEVDDRRLTPAKLRLLLDDSPNYMVHRTEDPAPGTLKEPVEARQPIAGEHAAKGVYAMRGISGIPNNAYGVVFVADARFARYPNTDEYICTRDLQPEEAVGWYTNADLKEAQALRK